MRDHIMTIANNFPTITDKMKNFIKNSGTSPSVKFENRQDYQPIFDNKRQVGLAISSDSSQTEHEIADACPTGKVIATQLGF